MSEPNAFNRRHIEQAAAEPQTGLLEQMNLPPAMISFIRKNQRTIWIVVVCVALVITAVSLYASYREHREEKAAAALTVAKQAEMDERQAMLAQVADEYGSTSSARWARVEIAHLAAEAGRQEEAVQILTEVEQDVAKKNPLKPLVLYQLGSLQEKLGNTEQAAVFFNELLAYPGFEATAYSSLGRIYELQGKSEPAVEMYRKYLDLADESGIQPDSGPDRQIIESRIRQLQK